MASMGPPPSRPVRAAAPCKKRVLEEDAYTQVVEAIIERDFFPSIPKLQNKLEFLQAVQSGDPEQIRRAQINIARRRAGLKTPLPGETPASGSGFTNTPGTLLRTPAMTPLARPDTGAATPGGAAAASAAGALTRAAAEEALAAAEAAGASAPKLSLDAFLANYTGEDNASFEELLEAHNARKRARVAHHLEGKDAPLLLEGPSPTDEYGSSGQAPSTLVLWKFEPKNKLYYDSSQQKTLAYSDKERAAMVAGPPKGIRHAATRVAQDVEEEQQLQLAAAGLLPDDDDDYTGGGGGRALAADPAKAVAAGAAPPPQHGGGAAGARAYLRTPSLAPGVGASPLMTWGDIAATPLRLMEGPDDDLASLGIDPQGGEGPQFKLPQVRRREAAARVAFDKKKAAAMRRKPGGGPAGGSATPLMDSMRRGAAGTPLSSAAQRLVTQLGKGKAAGAADRGMKAKGSSTGLLTDSALQQRLRASYGGTPSGARPPTATPQLASRGATPQLRGAKGGGASSGAAAVGKHKGHGSSSGGGGGFKGSITDNLLKLPK